MPTAPSITVHPISQIILKGQPVTLSVVATGDPAPTYQWYFNGAVIPAATSASYTIATVASGNSGDYLVHVTNGSGTAISNAAGLTVAETISDNIELQIATLLAGMRTTAGYNFNWSIVNEEDEAIGDFPRAVINPRDGFADKETSMDTVTGIGSVDYTNEMLFTILVNGDLPAFDTNPSFSIRSIMRQSLDDMKKLFGTYNQLNGACDNILYKGSQIEPVKTGDIMSAGQLRTLWMVVYSQDRINPRQYASS